MGKCLQCGYCCRVIVIPNYGYDKKLMKMKKEFKKKIEYLNQTYYVISCTCKHLTKDNKCGINDEKPEICRKTPENNEFWRKLNKKCGMVK